MKKEWEGFKEGPWTEEINVSDFIKSNYTKYDGDEAFLKGTTKKTDSVWGKCSELLKEELKKLLEMQQSPYPSLATMKYRQRLQSESTALALLEAEARLPTSEE